MTDTTLYRIVGGGATGQHLNALYVYKFRLKMHKSTCPCTPRKKENNGSLKQSYNFLKGNFQDAEIF
jgi:hypothetical protein